jgi:hypothetical protein
VRTIRRITTLALAAALTAALAVPAAAQTVTFAMPDAHRTGPNSFELPADASATLQVSGLTDAGGAPQSGLPAALIEDGPIDRAQLATFLVRAMRTAGVLGPDDALSDERVAQILDRFDDVGPGDPHAADIAMVVERGAVSGTSARTFSPEREVPRDQTATLFLRAVADVQPALPTSSSRSHYEDISGNPHAQNIDVLAEAGILPPARYFYPRTLASRAALVGWTQRLAGYASRPGDPGPMTGLWHAQVERGSTSFALDHRDRETGAVRGTGPHRYATVVDGIGRGTVTVTWTRDAPAVVRFTEVPPRRTTSPSATFAWTSSDPSVTFSCDLNGRGWSRGCTSPQHHGGLPARDHRFSVRAIASDGTVLATIARTWTIEPPFVDATGVHAVAIATVAEAGIAAGYADGTFRPNATVTRAQMASFLNRALDLTPTRNHGFRDVSGPHAEAIAAVAAAGIATGYGDGTYRPNEPVTRAQMATFLTRAYRLPAASRHGFSDVSGPHEGSIAAVAAAGVASGYDDGTYRPARAVTRAQMATFLVSAADR